MSKCWICGNEASYDCDDPLIKYPFPVCGDVITKRVDCKVCPKHFVTDSISDNVFSKCNDRLKDYVNNNKEVFIEDSKHGDYWFFFPDGIYKKDGKRISI